MKRIVVLLVVYLTILSKLYAQNNDYKNAAILSNNAFYGSNGKKSHLGAQITVYNIIRGGYGISFASGFAYNNSWWQSSLNASINFIFGKNNLGNYKRWDDKKNINLKNNPNWWLCTIAFSPMITFGSQNRYTFYEELNPMYFGYSSAIGNNFKHAFTLGTTFITMPKGKYANIVTPRNRSQHLLYLQFKSGDFLLNVVEDYLAFTEYGIFQALADNRDRYYTGGGSVQFRINSFYKLKFYTETYTGTSYPDYLDYPDVASPNRKPYFRFKSKTLREKYAYQDPGQKSLNNSRNFFEFEIPYTIQNNLTSRIDGFSNIQLYMGWSGGLVNGLQQHLIHNAMPIGRNVALRDYKNRKDQLHHFDYKVPPHDAGRMIFGLGLTTNTY